MINPLSFLSDVVAKREPNSEFIQTVQEAAAEKLRLDALRRAGSIGLLGLGLGAGARGLIGMYRLAQSSKNKKKKEEEDALDNIKPIPLYGKTGSDKLAGFLSGQYATSTAGVPWAAPMLVGSAGLGAVGGWKFLDYILDKRRRAAVDRELEEAKKEYENALRSKSGSDLSAELDRLYDNSVRIKSALSWGELLGRLAGLYGVYALGSGTVGGILGYQYGKSQQRKTMIEEAQKMRERERLMRQPQPLVAVPGDTTEEEEEDASSDLSEY